MATPTVSFTGDETILAGVEIIPSASDDPKLTELAFQLWHAGSLPEVEPEEEDEPEVVACHSSCL